MVIIVALTSLQAARAQMAVSLGFHIVFAALAVGLPAMLLFAEYRANRTGDAVWMALCRRWARALGILVAVGAVSGTVLSFALGLFWPGLMGRWGAVMTTHMIVAAYMATGFTVAAVYAVGMLKGRRDVYHRRGLAVGLVLGLALAPIQIVVGDAAARLVADRQQVKLAAMEGLWRTTTHAPLTIGGNPLAWAEGAILGLRVPGGRPGRGDGTRRG